MSPKKNKGEPYYVGEKLAKINKKDYNKRSRTKWNDEHANDYITLGSKLPAVEGNQVKEYVKDYNEVNGYNGRERNALSVSKIIRIALKSMGVIKIDEEDERNESE